MSILRTQLRFRAVAQLTQTPIRFFADKPVPQSERTTMEQVGEGIKQAGKAFQADGSIGKEFNADGSVGGTAQAVGGPFDKDGAIGKNFNADGAIGGTGQKVAESAEEQGKEMKK